MKLIKKLFLFYFLFHIQIEASTQTGKWLNLSLSKQMDLVLFDFDRRAVSSIEGDTYMFELKPDTLTIYSKPILRIPLAGIDATHDSLTFFVRQGETSFKWILINSREFMSAGIGSAQDLKGRTFEVIEVNSVKPMRRTVFEFLPNDQTFIETSLTKKDTLSSFYPYKVVHIDSLTIVHIDNMQDTKFFIQNRGAYYAVTRVGLGVVKNYRWEALDLSSASDIIHSQLLGRWELRRGQSRPLWGFEFQVLHFCPEYVDIRDSGVRQHTVRWWFSQFGKIIILKGYPYARHLDIHIRGSSMHLSTKDGTNPILDKIHEHYEPLCNDDPDRNDDEN